MGEERGVESREKEKIHQHLLKNKKTVCAAKRFHKFNSNMFNLFVFNHTSELSACPIWDSKGGSS